MFNRYKKILLVPLFGLLLTGNAFAITTEPPNVLTGINGLINVSEQPCGSRNMVACNNGLLAFGVQYSINIIGSSVHIDTFAISTNTVANSGDVWTSRNNWLGEQMSPTQWDGVYGMGSFNALFGSDYYVNLFSQDLNSAANLVTNSSDQIFEFFHDFSSTTSDFVVLNSNIGIIDQSRRANAVPEPAPLALLGFGLLGLGLMRGRRRS